MKSGRGCRSSWGVTGKWLLHCCCHGGSQFGIEVCCPSTVGSRGPARVHPGHCSRRLGGWLAVGAFHPGVEPSVAARWMARREPGGRLGAMTGRGAQRPSITFGAGGSAARRPGRVHGPLGDPGRGGGGASARCLGMPGRHGGRLGVSPEPPPGGPGRGPVRCSSSSPLSVCPPTPSWRRWPLR